MPELALSNLIPPDNHELGLYSHSPPASFFGDFWYSGDSHLVSERPSANQLQCANHFLTACNGRSLHEQMGQWVYEFGQADLAGWGSQQTLLTSTLSLVTGFTGYTIANGWLLRTRHARAPSAFTLSGAEVASGTTAA